MLLGKMINSAASLNNFHQIGSIDYVIADQIIFNFQLYDPQMKQRYIAPSTAIVTLTFNNMDGSSFTQAGTFLNPLDQSLITVTLSPTKTSQLLGGNVVFTVDVLGDGSQILRGIIYSALHQIITNIPTS